MEAVGFIGATLLAICAIPQAVQSMVHGHSRGLNTSFLWSWFLGEIAMLSYVVIEMGTWGPLFFNYAANTGLLAIIVYYRHFPRG